jgi:CRP-like cAMP-binding protein
MAFSESRIKKLVSSFLTDLQKDDIHRFLSICTYENAKNKELILKKGRLDKNLIFILKGSARAFQISEEGREINNHLRSEGFVFGEATVFGDGPQMLNISAIGELHYLKFDINELEQLAFKHKGLMQFYLGMMKEIIITFSHRINTFVSMTTAERYEDLIKWNPKYLESTFDKHIASFLGVSPLTIHRVKNMQKNNK